MKKVIAVLLFTFYAAAGIAQEAAVKEVKFFLNNRNRFSRSTTVPLVLEAKMVKEFQISNFEDFPGARWTDLSKVPGNWELENREGEHTIYVRFRDDKGAVSKAYSQKIILDTGAPEAGKVQIVAAADDKNRDPLRVDLLLEAEGAYFMQISNEDTFYKARWMSFRKKFPNWHLGGTDDGNRTVFVKFRDKAGNISPVASHSLTIDTQGPVGAGLIIDQNNEFCNRADRQVTLTLRAKGAVKMRVSEQENFEGSEWEEYQESRPFILSDSLGDKRIYAIYKDMYGNISQIASDNIYLDNQAPTEVKFTINNGDSITYDRDNMVDLQFTAKDADLMMVSNSLIFEKARWQKFSPSIRKWKLPYGDGQRTVYLKLKDRYDNETGIYQAVITAMKK